MRSEMKPSCLLSSNYTRASSVKRQVLIKCKNGNAQKVDQRCRYSSDALLSANLKKKRHVARLMEADKVETMCHLIENQLSLS